MPGPTSTAQLSVRLRRDAGDPVFYTGYDSALTLSVKNDAASAYALNTAQSRPAVEVYFVGVLNVAETARARGRAPGGWTAESPPPAAGAGLRFTLASNASLDPGREWNFRLEQLNPGRAHPVAGEAIINFLNFPGLIQDRVVIPIHAQPAPEAAPEEAGLYLASPELLRRTPGGAGDPAQSVDVRLVIARAAATAAQRGPGVLQLRASPGDFRDPATLASLQAARLQPTAEAAAAGWGAANTGAPTPTADGGALWQLSTPALIGARATAQFALGALALNGPGAHLSFFLEWSGVPEWLDGASALQVPFAPPDATIRRFAERARPANGYGPADPITLEWEASAGAVCMLEAPPFGALYDADGNTLAGVVLANRELNFRIYPFFLNAPEASGVWFPIRLRAYFEGGPVCETALLLELRTPRILSFAATPPTIRVGETAELAWTTRDAESVFLTPGEISGAPTGAVRVSPATTTAYTMEARGFGVRRAALALRVRRRIQYARPLTLEHSSGVALKRQGRGVRAFDRLPTDLCAGEAVRLAPDDRARYGARLVSFVPSSGAGTSATVFDPVQPALAYPYGAFDESALPGMATSISAGLLDVYTITHPTLGPASTAVVTDFGLQTTPERSHLYAGLFPSLDDWRGHIQLRTDESFPGPFRYSAKGFEFFGRALWSLRTAEGAPVTQFRWSDSYQLLLLGGGPRDYMHAEVRDIGRPRTQVFASDPGGASSLWRLTPLPVEDTLTLQAVTAAAADGFVRYGDRVQVRAAGRWALSQFSFEMPNGSSEGWPELIQFAPGERRLFTLEFSEFRAWTFTLRNPANPGSTDQVYEDDPILLQTVPESIPTQHPGSLSFLSNAGVYLQCGPNQDAAAAPAAAQHWHFELVD